MHLELNPTFGLPKLWQHSEPKLNLRQLNGQPTVYIGNTTDHSNPKVPCSTSSSAVEQEQLPQTESRHGKWKSN
jgi:hypothetical protein